MNMYLRGSIGLFITVLLLSGCEQQNVSQVATPQMAHATAVSYVKVSLSTHNIDTKLQGRVTASKEAEVRPQVSGIIQKRLFTEGQMVEQGQTLYQIESETYQAAYNEAKATLNSALAVFDAAKLKDERYAKLLKIEGVSQQDADEAHAAHIEAKANVEMYQAALDTAKINLKYTNVLAPISGRIGISSVTEGALVSAQQDSALATIRTLDPIYVDMTQSSKSLLKIRKLMLDKGINQGTTEVTLTLEDGSEYELTGELKMQEVAVDASTGAVTLRAEFANPNGFLLPGMFVRASVNEGVNNKAILVPQQGIYHSATDKTYAYVINQDNIIEKRSVEIASAVDNKWVVTDGLSSNDKLLVEGSSKVRPGSQVKPIQVEMDSNGVMIAHVDNDQATLASQGSK
ncbi:efflux RND transporter periplasmic adaptor subunit [Shewanella basaltis]|uniref:efflux RND transporter periplasmic adaptor subunit n=1 Tax=Shewanella basaltis TaxID=472183 RepID=UPI00200F948E|nr:efflux RND transporter periplasmic adaptor subunit [Shewanella basaltis]MCL1114503.1 efflux RND transporter periplasmic adaptor subunit [Shewanella basaltis]